MNLKKFYKNKRIFITGHTGFKGSWLASCLLNFDSKIMGYSKKDIKIKNYKKICYYKKIKNIYADILDYQFLKKKLFQFKPQIIFHLAAQSLVSESYRDPVTTIKTNVLGTLNILNISRELKHLKSIVVITSDKCYQNKEILRGYIENDTLGGDDPYSASKASAEHIFNCYSKSFFSKQKKFGYASARAGNVIGGGDWSKDRLIPDCVRSVIQNKNLIIRNPESTRPWQHVLEPISGYLVLAKKIYEKKNKYSGSWNFGPKNNETMKVKDVINLFFIYLNKKKKIIVKKSKFIEAKLLKLNSNKSITFLKWTNKWNMKKSIFQTASWYKQFLEKKKIKEISMHQIKDYFKN